ncbi:TetR/AcrR family transcriptional regulator C-terminal domain-containing protein [Nocardia sp. NPDC056000]|uniref:TetR/AcrR family transcriptional regulator C-terminal domain-containing protein n=1 Tax=Nocardia sp. NPDC056000 TaxID=3345674 RepID=UPI0035D847E7
MPRTSKSLEDATPEAIARAGLAIIESSGAAQLSFRAIATYLGVSHTTVVRRGGGDFLGLLDLLADHLAADLPAIAPGSGEWARATEERFVAWYTLIAAHPGLVLLRGSRPLLGPCLLARLTEPQVADNLSLGLTLPRALQAYREMYLFTLGCAAMVEHRDTKAVQLRTRSTLAALDPDEYPLLSGHLNEVAEAIVDVEPFHDGLRRLIASWAASVK